MNRIAVVVPAHNEEELLPGCLAALAGAGIVVVADACTDRTAGIAAAAGAEVVVVNERNVGRARAAGVEHALRGGADGLWLATTDADSRVGPGWRDRQLWHARAGAGLVVGAVAVDDWACWAAGLPARYESLYRRSDDHVHGANLGFSPAAYRAAGGFPGVTHDEDQIFVRRAIEAGVRVVRDPAALVHTSSRAVSRAPHGFATHLGVLAAGLTPSPRPAGAAPARATSAGNGRR